MMTCDPVTGACLLPEPAASASGAQPVAQAKPCVHYIGDPMCSWCWGIQPVVSEMAAFCAAEGIDFALTVGGLRAGGGDLWNADFTDFLRAEWRHIGEVTGQPFGSALLDAPHFDYDTEPACRAVVTADARDGRQRYPCPAFFLRGAAQILCRGSGPEGNLLLRRPLP
ncbi:hypothetical protein [Pseudomonas aeruginosa]|uniref:hypothetical protein n=1 Tax=Pseudomonas aeruginosa TaxID=287 RepID=UPI000A752BD9|nr:hypothetical protein [Pseudomonas aeruginosa]